MLVGIAAFDGVSYASLIDRKNQEHFLISSDKTTNGIKLTSITPGHAGSDTFAVVQKNGQPLRLKLEQPPATASAGGPNGMPPGMPPGGFGQGQGNPPPQIQMPGGFNPYRPMIHNRRPLIHLPAPPGQQPQSYPPPNYPSVPPK